MAPTPVGLKCTTYCAVYVKPVVNTIQGWRGAERREKREGGEREREEGRESRERERESREIVRGNVR
jgi:hypothetical protein